jgi:hypothetical protein
MEKEESQQLETDDEMIRNGKNVYEILHAWATSGTQLAYSTGTCGVKVEGTIRAMREPEDSTWGVFESSFLFMSKTNEITAYVLLMPGMKIRFLTRKCKSHCFTRLSEERQVGFSWQPAVVL